MDNPPARQPFLSQLVSYGCGIGIADLRFAGISVPDLDLPTPPCDHIPQSGVVLSGRFRPVANAKQASEQRNTNVGSRTDGAGIWI
jgi:hypothetical protein